MVVVHHNLDPDGPDTTGQRRSPLQVLADAGWTPPDIVAFDAAWPYALAGDLAGILLCSAAELADSGCTPSEVLDWLTVFYAPDPDGQIHSVRVTGLAVAAWNAAGEARHGAVDGTWGVTLVAVADAITAYARVYRSASDGDHDIAVLSARAGLTPAEVSAHVAKGCVSVNGLRALAGLRDM